MKRIITHIAILLLLGIQAFAQQVKRPEINMDEFIQKLSAVQQDDSNYEDLYESLMQFYLNPLDLNRANADELRSLNILSEIQIANLLDHILRHGKLLSLYELQTITGFDLQTIQYLLPFAVVRDGLSPSSITGILNRATDHFLVVRNEQTLEKAKGYTEGDYLGSPQKLYLRYRLQHPKDFSLGFISEKDQGEQSVFDYTSFHFQLMNKGNFRNIILGDYHLQFGQGLICSGGYAAGKGAETIYTTRRSDLGIRAHNSVLEGGFFRGAGFTYKINRINFTLFGSYTARDATINTDLSDDQDEVFSSILIAGLHRTESELAKKGTLKEVNLGGNIKYIFPNGHLGFTALQTQFDNSIQRKDLAYAYYEFKGNTNFVVGPNFSFTWQNFNFFGEAARSSSGGIGATGGFVAALSPYWEWSLNLRNYDKDFHSFYSNAFGEGSRTINERGIYTGIKFTPKRSISVAAFYDKFSFPWLRYLVDAPSEGDDYLLRFTYKPNRQNTFYTQFHRERKQRNMPGNDSYTDFLINTFKTNFLANYEYSINRTFKIQSRLQYNTFKYENGKISRGFALIQDLEGSIKKLQLKSRIAFYKTDDYNSRIYAYENDVLYAVSFPAYYGKGVRLYLVARYPINKKLDIWIRISRTSLDDVNSIGSGNTEIPYPHRTDVKLQIRMKF